MLVVISARPFFARRENGNLPRYKPCAVFAAAMIPEDFPDLTEGINPAGHAVVAAAEQGNAVLHGAECSTRGVLPLRSALAEPAVVREVHEKIGVVVHVFADEMGKRVLETDQWGKPDAGWSAVLRPVALSFIG